MNLVSNNYINQSTNANTLTPLNFKGHAGHEVLKLGKDVLILRHETAFFREYKTLNKSINYLRQKFPNEKSPKLIVGACSTGEEAFSIKMLLHEREPEILAFDISEDAVQKAKVARYTISQPKDKLSRKFIDERQISAYSDEYLGFSSCTMTCKKKMLKNLFDKMFTEVPLGRTKNIFAPIKKGMNYIRYFLLGDMELNLNNKVYTIKQNEQSGCKFMQGDIKNLDKIAPEGKAHAVFFRNALYHLVTNDIAGGVYRIPKKTEEASHILTNIVKQVNKALVKDGIFVIGEQENRQMTDTKLLSKILAENGFKPVEKRPKNYCNIWVKYKNAE